MPLWPRYHVSCVCKYMRIDELLANPFPCPFGMNLVEVLLNNLLIMINNIWLTPSRS